MNQTSSTLSNTSLSSGTDVVSVLTTAHLIWIALLAAIVIAGIVYGSRVKHRRVAAEHQVKRNVAEAGVETAAPGEPPRDEIPVEPATAPTAERATTTASAAAIEPDPSPSTADAASGPVTQLKGLGPKVAGQLAALGITKVGQLAALDDDGARRLDDQMGPFRGRLERDRWIEQARFLAAGDVKGFEAVFGRL